MLALAGWLPVWDLERRHIALDEVLAWTYSQLGTDELGELCVASATARELAQRLTKASLDPALRRPLHAALREMIPELPWQHVLVQSFAHFRILCPGDHVTPVPPHCDHGFGHALDERNLWLALTDASGAGALHACDLQTSLARIVADRSTRGVIADAPLAPMEVKRGDALLFTPLHLHAARAPERCTRVSIDLRIVPTRGNTVGPSFSPLWSTP
jgi:Phytanoyl-CoA dioxygenase (PhyH)